MKYNECHWKEKADHAEWKYEQLLKKWQQLLVRYVGQEREIMERDKVIIALQDRVKQLTNK